jgi:5'-3' exonuclease
MTADVASLLHYKRVYVDNIIFAMDNGKSRRVKQFKEYKAHRGEAIKKKSDDYKEKLKKFNEDYNKFEQYLRNYGKVISLPGVEADDIASILTKSTFSADGNKIYLLSSDSDWVKFVDNDSTFIINPQKNKVIKKDNLKEVYGYDPLEKLYLDCFAGVAKENVPGLFRFGPKTFMKIYEENERNFRKTLKAISSIYDGSSRLPEGFETVEEMFYFNFELFRPWTFEDLTDEEKEILKKELKFQPYREIEKIVSDSYELFGNIYMPSSVEIEKFYLQ